MYAVLSVFVAFLAAAATFAQSPSSVYHLWPNGAPGFEKLKDEPEVAKDWYVRSINNPSVTAFLPSKEKSNGTALVVVAGGGHQNLVFNAEGIAPSEYFSSLGIAAFALKYRLGRQAGSPYKIEIHAKQDGYRAVRFVRAHAREWGIDPHKVGMIGFSAGGEVVSMLAYDHADGDPASPDPIERESGRPDFQILMYPGNIGIPDVIPPDAPPTFLMVANDDPGASGTVLDLLTKYRNAHRPVEAHFFQEGGHGFNMGGKSKFESIKHWQRELETWMIDRGYLPPSQ